MHNVIVHMMSGNRRELYDLETLKGIGDKEPMSAIEAKDDVDYSEFLPPSAAKF